MGGGALRTHRAWDPFTLDARAKPGLACHARHAPFTLAGIPWPNIPCIDRRQGIVCPSASLFHGPLGVQGSQALGSPIWAGVVQEVHDVIALHECTQACVCCSVSGAIGSALGNPPCGTQGPPAHDGSRTLIPRPSMSSVSKVLWGMNSTGMERLW